MKPTDCQYTLPFHSDRKLTVDFEGGRVSSDAGLMLLHAVDRGHGLSRGFAACLKDERDQRYVQHRVETLTAQRVLQIAAGYEDGNDADSLRSDAALKSFCDRLPESGPELASGATLCRLENSVDRRSMWRVAEWLVQGYARRLQKSGRRRIVLDLDSTDDPTHGEQEFSFYHGYFGRHIYHPLLVFDAETGDLIAAVLRAGNRGAAARAVSVLRRIVRILRQRVGRRLEIEIRADCGFATPDLYQWCEDEELDYTIGLPRNPRLERAVEPLLEKAQADFESEGVKQRRFGEFAYQADSWQKTRRVIAKVEVHEPGLNRRFVVTNRRDAQAQGIYDHYTQRGQSENYIKAFKNDLKADRLSCHRFAANQFRLLLHGLAYQLLLALRRYLEGTPPGRSSRLRRCGGEPSNWGPASGRRRGESGFTAPRLIRSRKPSCWCCSASADRPGSLAAASDNLKQTLLRSNCLKNQASKPPLLPNTGRFACSPSAFRLKNASEPRFGDSVRKFMQYPG